MCEFIGKSNERILSKLSKGEILGLYLIVHVAMETTKTSNVSYQSKSFISIFFTCQVSACQLQPSSCHNLANELCTQKLPKLCSATLTDSSIQYFFNLWDHNIPAGLPVPCCYIASNCRKQNPIEQHIFRGLNFFPHGLVALCWTSSELYPFIADLIKGGITENNVSIEELSFMLANPLLRVESDLQSPADSLVW